MSLISWLFPPKASKPAPVESSGLSRVEATRPVSSGRKSAPHGSSPSSSSSSAPGQAANRKGERMARRELLYGVVREAMVRAGVLSSSYKFKVLSLDSRGRQFLIMMDLAREVGDETSRLAEIEALIAQSAKSRYDIVVTAVYWRLNEHVAVGLPAQRAPSARPSGPMPLEPLATPAAAAPDASHRTQPLPRYEPIEADEVAAFKRALAVAAAAPVAAAATAATAATASAKAGPRSYTLLTGYEDTEMPEPAPALSGTQYGELN